MTAVTIYSPSNNRNLSFRVYMPPGYSTELSRRYPVVISLHGIGGTGQQRASLYAPTLDARIATGDILPMIWVLPDGQSNSFYGDSFDGHKQVYSHIVGEVLPYVGASFRTIADRSYRAMEGFSMGGFGAGMYTAKHPELFSAILEYGGALATWEGLVQFNNAVAEEMYDLKEVHFLPYSLWNLTTNNAAALRCHVNYKMIVGNADSQYQSNVRFRDHLLSLGIDPQFQVLPGVAHVASEYLNEGSGLEFLSDHFATVFRQSGDYNRNGAIDAQDFETWRNAFGSSSLLAADGSGNGVVDAADYVLWRRQHVASAVGMDTTRASLDAVPEPTAPVCAATPLLGLAFCRFNRRRRRGIARTAQI